MSRLDVILTRLRWVGPLDPKQGRNWQLVISDDTVTSGGPENAVQWSFVTGDGIPRPRVYAVYDAVPHGFTAYKWKGGHSDWISLPQKFADYLAVVAFPHV